MAAAEATGQTESQTEFQRRPARLSNAFPAGNQGASAAGDKSHPPGESSVLFLWTIDKYLFDAQRIAEELGFKLHARMIWNKVNGIPAAFTVRFGHEYLLYMYKGKLTPVATEERGKIHTVFTEKVRRHSQKPEISYEIINRLYPNLNKLELYARYAHDGFDIWGNEAPE